MGRIIDPNDHNQHQRPRPQKALPKKPTWLGEVGEPCGYCCLTMWWIDRNNYDRFPCPITFPNNKEYRKFCIDYNKSILYGVNTYSSTNDIRAWGAFRDISAIIKKRSQPDRGGPGLALPPNYLSSLKKNSKLSGQQLCENFYEILKILEGAGEGTFGIDSYSWSDIGYCGSEECDCTYPCEDAVRTKKVWTGSGDDCICAEPLIELFDGDCYCKDDNYGLLSKKEIITLKARNNQFTSIYPFGRCVCKSKTTSGKSTYLLGLTTENGECPECNCKESQVNKGIFTYLVDSVWVTDEQDAPGRCDCDESLGLIKDSTKSTDSILVCKCSEPNYVWDSALNTCVLDPECISWGTVSDIQVEYDEDPNQSCPVPGQFVKYTFSVTIEDLGLADGATVTISVDNIRPNRLTLKGWRISGDNNWSEDNIINRSDIDSLGSYDPPPFPNAVTVPADPIPTTITIGKHFSKNIFSPGKRKSYYDKYLNFKHFYSGTNNQYTINYVLVYRLETLVGDKETFGIKVSLNDVKPYVLSDPLFLATYENPISCNAGSGYSESENIKTFDINCEEPTEEPTHSPSG